MPELEPITRLEEYLSKLAGDDVPVPAPITRVEKFLAYIAGEADSKPTPITRVEKFLDAIGQGGGGGGGGETVIVPEQALTVEEDEGIYYSLITVDAVPEVGDECTITLNGTDYTITATTQNGRTVLGNYNGSNPDFTNYPFAIAFSNVDPWIDLETDGTYTLKVTKGGGGGSATIIEKNITSNGTYNASSDSADGYNPVNVSVPNSYSAGDEGKVVSNGALVSQTAATYTVNSVYDTTLIDTVTVNVSGGGGSGLTLLTTDSVAVTTVSTSTSTVKTIEVSFEDNVPYIGVLAFIRDHAGARNNYFEETVNLTIPNASGARTYTFGRNANGVVSGTNSGYGVYIGTPSSTASDGIRTMSIPIASRYGSGYGTIDGTYDIAIYSFDVRDLV